MGSGTDGAQAGEALFYHGGNLGAARLRFPGAPQPWIDLSTGINPVPYPVTDLPPEDWSRLPEPSALESLQETAARAYGIDGPGLVAAAPGTQALLQVLPRLVPARRVGILGFTYAEHESCWSRAGATVVTVDHVDDLAGFDVGVVVNPNNPDGRLCPPDQLRDLAGVLARRQGLLVVDEAFADVLPPESSVARHVGTAAGLLVLRSFGKTYGLAGARLGFALGERRLVEGIREALGPWAVSGPALTLGRRALADAAWLAATCARLDDDMHHLAGLVERAGLRVVGGTPLYLLAEHPKAGPFFDGLGRRGVLVRAFAQQPAWLRFGLPHPGQRAVLEQRMAGLAAA